MDDGEVAYQQAVNLPEVGASPTVQPNGGNMGDLIIKAALKYIESHPEVVEELVHLAIGKIVEALKKPASDAK